MASLSQLRVERTPPRTLRHRRDRCSVATKKAPCEVRKEPSGAADAHAPTTIPGTSSLEGVRGLRVSGRSSGSGFILRSRLPAPNWLQWLSTSSSSLTAAGPPRNHTGFPLRVMYPRGGTRRPAPMSCSVSARDHCLPAIAKAEHRPSNRFCQATCGSLAGSNVPRRMAAPSRTCHAPRAMTCVASCGPRSAPRGPRPRPRRCALSRRGAADRRRCS